MLTDFPINIDTVCFKLKCELTPELYEQWETKIYSFGLIKYVQTRRLVGGSSISFRYYPDFACLSILVDSVPALIYGNSQILFCEEDYQYFKECIVDTLNDAIGLIYGNGFSPDALDDAVLNRFDLNQDYYFIDKNNEIRFRNWLELFKLPYANQIIYETGGKKTRKALNLTYYSKDEQAIAKKNQYLNFFGDYCTRIEFQFKYSYLYRQPKLKLKDLLGNKEIREHYFKYNLKKINLDGEIMNRARLETFLKSSTNNSHKKSYIENIRAFYLDLGKYGIEQMKKECKSFYYYLRTAKVNKKIPIRMNDNVFKELKALKEKIYYSFNS